MREGIKVGRLKMSIAKAIKTKCADIYISENYIRHISQTHKKELNSLGFGALEYVNLIANKYNQIRKGTGNSLLLVVYTKDVIHHVAAISLNYDSKKGIWEVKTAQPRRTKEIEKKKILWQNLPKF